MASLALPQPGARGGNPRFAPAPYLRPCLTSGNLYDSLVKFFYCIVLSHTLYICETRLSYPMGHWWKSKRMGRNSWTFGWPHRRMIEIILQVRAIYVGTGQPICNGNNAYGIYPLNTHPSCTYHENSGLSGYVHYILVILYDANPLMQMK